MIRRFCAIPEIGRRREVRAAAGGPGFTLLELLLVVAVVAVLASLFLGASRGAIEAGRVARARGELAALEAALAAYRRIHGDYPRTDDARVMLEALRGRLDPRRQSIESRPVYEPTRERGAGTAAEMLDPWGRAYRYVYRVPAAGWVNPGFVLWSAGPDGRDAALVAGGYGDAAAPENADNVQPEEQ